MDVLVNSAGLGIGGAFADQDTKRIDVQLDVNLRATLIVTRESLPLLRASKGQIVTIASIAGTIPTPALAVYGATKAALIAFTNSLNREEEEHGIRATAHLPGVRRDADDGLDRHPGRGDDPVEDIVDLVQRRPPPGPRARVPQIVVERVGDVV